MTRCTATTLSGARCRRLAASGSLCAFHAGMAATSLARPATQPVPPVDSVPPMPAPHIAAADPQPPLVAVIMDAAQAVESGEVQGDDELGLLIAQALSRIGGTHDDLEYLIEAGCAPDWTRGYFRALLAA